MDISTYKQVMVIILLMSMKTKQCGNLCVLLRKRPETTAIGLVHDLANLLLQAYYRFDSSHLKRDSTTGGSKRASEKGHECVTNCPTACHRFDITK